LLTRRIQTTIPAKIRRKSEREGTPVRAETKEEKVISVPVLSVFDLAGTSKLGRKRAMDLLNEMRKKR
jgi:hypothetical protein